MRFRTGLLCVFLSLLVLTSEAIEFTPASKRLIPRPEEIENLDVNFDLDLSNWHVGKGTDLFPLTNYYTGLNRELKVTEANSANAFFGTITDFKDLEFLTDAMLEVPEEDEGYYLEVTDSRIVVIGRTNLGAFYGIQTLRQLTEDDKYVVGCQIRDFPKMRYRAITDDISRGPIPKLEFMKLIVKTMSEYKLNMYSPYMELQVLDGIRSDGETISVDDYKELVEFARSYHVEIVPSLQTFGHCNNFLALPNYRHLGNLPSDSSQLDPTNPEVYEFLDYQITKWAKLTESEFINISGDETWEIEYGNSGIKVGEVGVAEVYLEHVLKVMDLVKKNGKIPLFWGDMVLSHPEIIDRLPDDAIVLNWHYGTSSSMPERLAAFQSKGKTQWAAPGIDNWLRIFPFYTGSNTNVNSFAKIGARYGAEGLFTTTWDDDGDTLFGNNFYGVIFAAEAAWKGGGPGTSFFNQRFDMAVFGEQLRIAEAIKLLSDTNYYTYQGYFNNSNLLFLKDPFADIELYGMAGSATQLLETEKTVLDILQNAKPKRNAHILDTLEFSARKNGTYARKILLAKEVIDTVTAIEGTSSTAKLRELSDKLYAFELEIRELYEEFERLYLEENKEYFLKELNQRYYSLRSCIFSKAMELENASYDQVVPSPEALGIPRSPKRKR
ncbi:MAG: family 20 glycosylhydrolase [Firmicutes bacterium]|nr:family 20 glycosylhydrolase [Bacillota bacterium]MDD4263684.1 family 20 glycosylhydrolase [Bacillota bacterium]MDD4693700.1 family 20 glycosylhydrolase [Bacillota bacterium]